MAGTALLIRKSRTKNTSITDAQSIILLKNVFRAAFSTVAYVRNFFDDDFFELRKIATARYRKIVKFDRDDVRRYTEWVEKGIFDALSKKYLEVVTLEVYEEQDIKKTKKNEMKRKLLECYKFHVIYTDGKAQLALTAKGDGDSQGFSKEQIKSSTGEVIRSLAHHASSLGPLPPDRILSVRLFYTKDTPEEYEPPLFRRALDDEGGWLDDTPLRIEAGGIRTPYHKFNVTIEASNKKTRQKKGAHGGNKKGSSRVDTVKFENAMTPKEKATGSNETWEQATTEIDVGSDANSGRVQKSYLVESQQMQVNADKSLSFNLKKSSENVGMKNIHGQLDEIDSKGNGRSRSMNKRKASMVDKQISQKRKRSKTLA